MAVSPAPEVTGGHSRGRPPPPPAGSQPLSRPTRAVRREPASLPAVKMAPEASARGACASEGAAGRPRLYRVPPDFRRKWPQQGKLYCSRWGARMSVNYAAGLSPYADKGKCGLPEVSVAGGPRRPPLPWPRAGWGRAAAGRWDYLEAPKLDNGRNFPLRRGWEATPPSAPGDAPRRSPGRRGWYQGKGRRGQVLKFRWGSPGCSSRRKALQGQRRGAGAG